MRKSCLAGVRSLLIFPGDDPRKQRSALTSGADATVLDLEDGVTPDAKEDARTHVESFSAAPANMVKLVRVNDPLTETGQADLAALMRLNGIDAILVPKASAAAVQSAAAQCDLPLVPLIESAGGLRCSFEIASQDSVVALALGSADLRAALDLVPSAEGQEILFARSKLVMDSGAAGLRAPFDGPCLSWNSSEPEDESRLARSVGMGGKICIHPSQVVGVHRGFGSTALELDWARSVLANWTVAQAAGLNVGVIDSELIDLPVVIRAQRLLDSAEGSDPA